MDIAKFWDCVTKTNGCWFWEKGRFVRASTGEKTYGCVTIGGRTRYAHHVAWELKHGAIPRGQHVLHSCDVPHCVRPSHLFLGTHQDTMTDKTQKDRVPFGEKSSVAKLTEAQVKEVLSVEIRPYGFCTKMARRFGVSAQAIYAIVYGKSWVRTSGRGAPSKRRP